MKYYLHYNLNEKREIITEEDKRKALLKKDIITNLKDTVTDKIKADSILALSGDGGLIDGIHKFHKLNKPFFGVNCGSFGFLGNEIYSREELPTSFENLEIITEPLLEATIYTADGKVYDKEYAVNEFTLCSKIAGTKASNTFLVQHGNTKFEPIIGDKLIIAGSIGSTGSWLQYNDGIPLIEHGIKTIGVQGIGTNPFKYDTIEDFNDELIINIHSRYPTMVEIDCSHKEIYDVKKIIIKYSQQLYQLCFLKENGSNVFDKKRRKLYQKKTNGKSSLIPSSNNE